MIGDEKILYTYGGIMKKTNLIIMVIFSGLILLTIGCSKEKKVYEVGVLIEYSENLMFNKYDAIINVDECDIDKIEQGEQKPYILNLAEGKHTILIYQDGKSDNKVEKEIEIKKPVAIHYSCEAGFLGLAMYGSSQIEIDTIKDMIKADNEQITEAESTTSTTETSEERAIKDSSDSKSMEVEKDGTHIATSEEEHTVEKEDESQSEPSFSDGIDPSDLHPQFKNYVDAKGYIDIGVDLYFEDEGKMLKIYRVEDIKHNINVDGSQIEYALMVYDYDLQESYWQDGDIILDANRKITGKPLYYIDIEDPCIKSKKSN